MAVGKRGLLMAAPAVLGVLAIVVTALVADTHVLVAVVGVAVVATVASVGLVVVLSERRVRAAVGRLPGRTADHVTRALPAPPAPPAPLDERGLAERLMKPLDRLVRREFGQVEQLLALYHEVEPPRALPPLRGWAASPDYLRSLYAQVREGRPRTVVECGSGASTLVIARALLANGEGRLVSLEHLEEHAAVTRDHLAAAGLAEVAEVVHAPLVEHRIGDETFTWYDVAAAGTLLDVDLVAVDGPPKAVGPLARYPALPLLREALDARAALLLDDADRRDEQLALARWEQEDRGLTWTRLGGEKGTVLVQRGQ